MQRITLLLASALLVVTLFVVSSGGTAFAASPGQASHATPFSGSGPFCITSSSLGYTDCFGAWSATLFQNVNDPEINSMNVGKYFGWFTCTGPGCIPGQLIHFNQNPPGSFPAVTINDICLLC